MKTVFFITYCQFWKSGSGFWARSRALIEYLAQHTKLTVISVRPCAQNVAAEIQAAGGYFRFVPLVGTKGVTNVALFAALKSYCATEKHADCYIVDKTELGFVFHALPIQSFRIVDTHDLVSQRTASSAKYSADSGLQLDEKQEIAILDQFDSVICIQSNDAQMVAGWIGKDKVVLAPHAAQVERQQLRKEVSSIGFVASGWIANIDGLNWFLDEVWGSLVRPGLSLDIYGHIGSYFVDRSFPQVNFHGHSASLADIYSNIDIVINPVRFGAGLKVKTLEAMANGLPLVTTGEGASGLLALQNDAFLVANSATAFGSAVELLITDYALRCEIGAAALDYTIRKLSPDACFSDLLSRINEH